MEWRDYVKHDQALVMAVEPLAACGNPAKAKRLLGWENTVPFDGMIARMVESELQKLA